ncbi:MAG: hypothetical protein K1X57_11070 [Gemmataceae bacterium]|nr:hypothetical protein [Gemmataceae bacterium]
MHRLCVLMMSVALFAEAEARGQEPATTLPPVPVAAPVTASPPTTAAADVVAAQPATTSYTPGDGLTVSMLNGTSKLKLFAQFSGIGVFATDRPFTAGIPFLILPPSPFGLNTNTFDLHARQSAFGAVFTGPEVLGFTPGANFLGFIQNDNLTSDAYGFLPYQAYGELKNEHWRIAAGLQSDVFNPESPTLITLAKMYGSGNTGSFRGQFRVEHFAKPSDDFQLTTQVALSEPVATVVTGNARIVEDNGWPNVEARLAAGIGAVEELCGDRKKRAAELGVSGVVGQLRSSKSILAPDDPGQPNRSVVNTWGLGVDADWAVTCRFGLAGELFVGQGLGEYNGGILQSYNSATLQPIRTRGGWAEAYYYVTDKFHVHSGYGIDAPLRRDLAPTQFAKNQTYFTNFVWDASKVLQLSFEIDYRKTDYIAFQNADGVVFMTQMLLRF